MRLTYRARLRLPRSKFACPSLRKYPIHDAAHVRNALARWSQRHTYKCKGGLRRICRAAKRFGIHSQVCRYTK